MKRILLLALALLLLCESALAMTVTPSEPAPGTITQEEAIRLAREHMLAATPEFMSDYRLPLLHTEGRLDVKAAYADVRHEDVTAPCWIVTFFDHDRDPRTHTGVITLHAENGTVLWEDYTYNAIFLREMWIASSGPAWSAEQTALFDTLYRSPNDVCRYILPKPEHMPAEQARKIAARTLCERYSLPQDAFDGLPTGYQVILHVSPDGDYEEWCVSFFRDGILIGQVNLDAVSGDIHLVYSDTDPGHG